MKVNKAIQKLMKDNNITQKRMATMIGKKRPNDVSARLSTANMSVDKVIEMLSVMGYELVIQKTTPGTRSKDQIVLEQSSSIDTLTSEILSILDEE